MKNSTLIKGTAAIAVGAALLLGGGGTLANWNDQATAAPGNIVSGDLKVGLNSTPGVWTDRAGTDITAKIKDGSYLVVPGDLLTFKQDLDVTLTGAKMAANITASGANAVNGFVGDSVTVSAPTLSIGTTPVANPLTTSKKVTATITFEFKSATTSRVDVNKTYNFNNVEFNLSQVLPAGA
ncbi:alternate-type signal peptide domain-containing protein [Arthrobacter sp. FX8]|uniref:alternate-type signal peptide domain-containing protein n=1 Tax=Arthrobacter sp. FX8 TaxID=2997335 RepID=UPI00227ACD2F|nr:alternate-type signal peptide domain-containing protein [Arthrobacter sp. FX8]WAJ31916.1 alternate-type signal peptide domain-containing protein [Arthrobacter sp. FX8]